MKVRGLCGALLALGLALSFGLTDRPQAAQANPFDGSWNVEIVCPMAADAQGYTWRMPVRIASGLLSGTYRSPTTNARGVLSGRVSPEGAALVVVNGRTDKVEYTVGHVRPGTPIHYTANVRFSGANGFGQRQQLRPCTLSFSRA